MPKLLLIVGLASTIIGTELMSRPKHHGSWLTAGALLLVVLGFVRLASLVHNWAIAGPAIVILVGCSLLLAPSLDLEGFSSWTEAAGTILLPAGVALVLLSARSPTDRFTPAVRCAALFGPNRCVLHSKALEHVSAVVLCGQLEVDLIETASGSAGVTLHCWTLFGELTIQYPPRHNVEERDIAFLSTKDAGIERRIVENDAHIRARNIRVRGVWRSIRHS